MANSGVLPCRSCSAPPHSRRISSAAARSQSCAFGLTIGRVQRARRDHGDAVGKRGNICMELALCRESLRQRGQDRLCSGKADGQAAFKLAHRRCRSRMRRRPRKRDIFFAPHGTVQIANHRAVLSTIAMETHQTSLPAMKARVPSIGSTTKVRRADRRAGMNPPFPR